MSTTNANAGVPGIRYATRSRAAAAKEHGKAGVPSQPKRALGDITNSMLPQQSNIPGAHGLENNSIQSGKVRRTVPTKPSSGAAQRRALAQRISRKQNDLDPKRFATTSGVAEESIAATSAAVAAASITAQGLTLSDDTLLPPLSLSCETQDLVVPPTRRQSFAAARLPHGVIDVDIGDARDPLAVSQFARVIFENFRAVETKFMVSSKYMDSQDDITVKMRAILVDWLVDVHQKFKLSPETLHLTVNIIDRFLAVTPVKRRKLQLVGVTAMLIASKYEEIYAPETADFVYISDKAYDREEILHMEAVILNVLNFDVTVPSSLTFWRRCLKASRSGMYIEPRGSDEDAGEQDIIHYTGGVSHDAEYFSLFILELCLQSATLLDFPASIRAACACVLGSKLCREEVWTPTLHYFSGSPSVGDMEQCEAAMLDLLVAEQGGGAMNKLTAIKRKFGTPKYNEVSTQTMALDLSSIVIGVPEFIGSPGPSDYASMDICCEDAT